MPTAHSSYEKVNPPHTVSLSPEIWSMIHRQCERSHIISEYLVKRGTQSTCNNLTSSYRSFYPASGEIEEMLMHFFLTSRQHIVVARRNFASLNGYVVRCSRPPASFQRRLDTT